MRLRVAEVDQDAVPEILLDAATGTLHRLGAARLVLVQHVAHVLGIQHLGERRRPHEIAEQDGEQPTLRRWNRQGGPALSAESRTRGGDGIARATSRRHSETPRTEMLVPTNLDGRSPCQSARASGRRQDKPANGNATTWPRTLALTPAPPAPG